MRQSRVAEAQTVSNYSSSPEPQSHICSLIYCIPSPQALSFPTLPGTRRPSLVQTHQDHRFELRLLCVQCWVWSSRPPTTLKQLQFFYYKEKKTHENSGCAHWTWNPDSSLLSFLLARHSCPLPKRRDQSFFHKGGCPEAHPSWEDPGDAQAVQLWRFALDLHIPACFGFSFF